MTRATQRTGAKGETIAADFLRGLGYHLHERNVRLPPDEIDIVAYDPSERALVFVEVKTRRDHHRSYLPSINITPSKLRALRRAARAWVAARGYDGSYRIDLIGVANGKVIEHVRELPWES